MDTEIFFGKSEIRLDTARIKRPSRANKSSGFAAVSGKREREITGERDWVHAGFAPIGSNSLEELYLKGFNHPVLAAEILRWREEAEDVEVAAAEVPRRRQPS